MLNEIFLKNVATYDDYILITQIKEIQQFGIYQNFQWSSNPDLKLFNKKNIIYSTYLSKVLYIFIT